MVVLRKFLACCVLAVCCAGVSSAASAAAQDDLFASGGFFVGCNYWARHAGMYMWRDWRPEAVARELKELAANGVQVMRVFPLWCDFQPLTGDCRAGGGYRAFRFRDNRDLPNPDGVDPEMMRRFRAFCDMAAQNRIRLIVGLVTGWMSGRHFVPSVFEDRDVTTDPEALMWQTRFVRHFVRAMKDHSAIAAWDYGNECNCLNMAVATTAGFYNWMDHIAMAIRSVDATRPVVSGMHGLSTKEDSPWPIRLNGELSDVLCTHPYQFYVPGCGKEAFNAMRTELHPTAESLLYRDLGGRPCFIEEVGNLGTSCTSEARTAAGTRAMLFSAWAHDLLGCLWWCNADQEDLDFPPYTLTPNERELGFMRADGTPKAALREMAAFQRFRASLPYARLPRAREDAVIVVSEKDDAWQTAFGAYLLAVQAGVNARFAGAERELPEAPLYIVCSASRDESYTYPAQKRLYAKARAGATVLVIYSGDARFTRLHENAGVIVDYCNLSPVTRTFALTSAPDCPMTATDKTTCRLLPGDAEVLAATKDGEPVVTRFRLGKGWMMLCNAPIDRETVARTDVLWGENAMPYWRVLRVARDQACLEQPIVKGDCPWVGITTHALASGRTLVIAVNYEPRAITCPITCVRSLGKVWRGDVTSTRLALPPNEAAVFELEKE